MPRKTAGLNHYNIQLKRSKIPFRCPYCSTRTMILSKDFQKHCAQHHHLNPRLCCVWCRGAKSWLPGQKYNQSDHLVQCWRDFFYKREPPVPPVATPTLLPSSRPVPISFDRTPLCPAEDFFGHEEMVLERLYDPIWPMPLGPHACTFSVDNLNLAASCLQMYLDLKDTMDIFHLSIRLVAFPSFLAAIDADEGRTRTLPFSTLCNGGQCPETRHRYHRHMIIVSPKDHFKSHVYKRIQISAADRPWPGYKCKALWDIHGHMHFIHLLGYLSRRPSKCNFSTEETIDENAPPSLHHFWIFKTLPKDYRLALFTQYDDGILDGLYLRYPSVSMEHLLRLPLVFFQDKWRLKIKHLPGIPLGIVLPVTYDMRPCSYPTPSYVYLLNGRKLYFEHDGTPNTWLQEQVENGNLFYFVVGEEYFTFRHDLQNTLREVKPLQKRIQQLETELARERQQNTLARRQVNTYQRKLDRLKRTQQTERRTHRRVVQDNTQLRRRNRQLREAFHRVPLAYRPSLS